MKLILIRHGATAANEEKRYCGVTDIGLSPAGKAKLQHRRNQTNYPDITGFRIITSGMKRSEQTLQILYGEVPHAANTAFREIDFGTFEMRTYEELKNDPRYLAWIAGDNEKKSPPGGESGEEMKKRVIGALDSLIAQGQDTLLLTHGGVIAAIMAHLFPDENKTRYEWQPEPGGGYQIDLIAKKYEAFA